MRNTVRQQKGLGAALPPPPHVGLPSKRGGWWCRLFGHDWCGNAVRGDDGEPLGELCRRCRAERSAVGGPCRCLSSRYRSWAEAHSRHVESVLMTAVPDMMHARTTKCVQCDTFDALVIEYDFSEWMLRDDPELSAAFRLVGVEGVCHVLESRRG